MTDPIRAAALRSFACAFTYVALQCVVASPAVADAPRPLQATIVQIDGDDVVIDAGVEAVDGARALTVYRTLEVRHPVTRKTLRDRFVIGTLSVAQTGQTLSVTRVSGTPAHPFRVGDTVEVTRAASDSPTVPAAVAAAPDQSSATLTDEQEVLRYWRATLTKTPEMRVRYYQDFLVRNPTSRYREFVQAEVTYLGELIASATANPSTTTPTHATPPPEPPARAVLTLLSPRSADEGQALEIAAHVRANAKVRSLILHARALEDSGFQDFVMDVDDRGHARVTVPASIVRAPGFAYFIVAVDTDGEVVEARGSMESPSIVTVKSTRRDAPSAEPTTRVRFTSEMVSFDGTSGRDYFLLNEGDFLYRVRFHRLYGVRLGYGNYRGQGGTVEQLDVLREDPQPAGFTYGFVETELELHALFGVAFRATIGLGRPDNPEQERDGVTGGFQVRARIGTADATHLILAGEFLPEIGQRAYIALHYEAIQRLPMQVEVVVTDQPVSSGELAVRLIYEVGYRFTDRIAVALRPSYQLRNIRHAGPGIGLAATFDW